EQASQERAQALLASGAEVLRVAEVDGRLDLASVVSGLAERGITRLMVEAGPILAAAFLKADLVDEAVLLRSASPLGLDAIDALEGMSLEQFTRSRRFIMAGGEAVGADTIERFERPLD